MSDIFPEEVCYSILLRIPAKPLFRFRSVCKSWRRIIDDTNFTKTHIQNPHEDENHLLIRNKTGKLYLLPLSSINCYENQAVSVKISNIKNIVARGVPKILSLPVTSSNVGVILIQPTYFGRGTILWNPFTGETFMLPSHDHLTNCCHGSGLGIGYDSVTEDFKVVKFVREWDSENRPTVRSLMYSLKLKSWKIIPNFLKMKVCIFGNGVFVNGALHWVTGWGIVCFDLSTEEDRVLPRPSFLLEGDNLRDFELDVLDGCLCVRNDRAIWMMKDYGGNLWTELVSSEQLRDMGRPIAYIKGKGQVLIHSETTESLLLFDVENKYAKKVQFSGFCEDGFTCQVLASSLYRLNRSAGCDGSIAVKGTSKRKRKTANKRLEVELKLSDV